jgi:hypothetical protein
MEQVGPLNEAADDRLWSKPSMLISYIRLLGRTHGVANNPHCKGLLVTTAIVF